MMRGLVGTHDFHSCGEDVTIYGWVRITQPARIDVGDHVIVDDFVFLQGGDGLRIGSHVHIASFVSITGGGRATVGDFVGISAGARVMTGSDIPDGSGLTGPTIPPEMRPVHRGQTVLDTHSFVGANAVIMPGVHVGEGAVVGAQAVVLGDVEPWTINVGIPARTVKERPRERMLEQAEQLRSA